MQRFVIHARCGNPAIFVGLGASRFQHAATVLGVPPRYSRRSGPTEEPDVPETSPCPTADFRLDREISVERGRGRGRGRGGRGGGGFRGRGGGNRQPAPQGNAQARGWSQGSAGVKPLNHEGGWKCACGGSNFKGRTTCFKCRQPKPADAAIIGDQGNTAAAPEAPWRCPCGMENPGPRKACASCFCPKV
uniref:RanBP2-type domain-containing protein n=1 Tax=Neobodo designis TaxID=312471 RepID=A0A7S1M8W7_NEODS